jgi:single-stranded-DNA-specific exonuclease
MQVEPAAWVLRGRPFEAQGNVASNGFPPILTHLIQERGLCPEGSFEAFLHPKWRDLSDPFLIPDMAMAVERILQAVDGKEEVCIFGDYDADGVSSITLLGRILEAYGLETRPFIPRRGSEGYGLSEAALRRCMDEGDRPELLISVDCGTVSLKEAELLRSWGVDLVVVDHHEPLADARPHCAALVNPKCGVDFTYLCAAGVVFKLGHALLKARPNDRLDLRHLADLVAVATIADIVPLTGENRLLVRQGLRQLAETSHPGLHAIKQASGLEGVPSTGDVGFRIGPRINAAGRLDAPEDALRTLMSRCSEEARELALKLNAYNEERRNMEALNLQEAEEMLANGTHPADCPVIVLGSRSWHPGVVGIVASKLMRNHHKPTFVIAIDAQGAGKGSGRSIEGLSLVEALRACEKDLVAGGGHAMAAGLTIREEHIDSFRKHLAAFVLANTTPEQRTPQLTYDAEVALDQLSLSFLDSYELLEPFGNGNPQPTFVSRSVSPDLEPKWLRGNHLKLLLRQGPARQEAVYFGGGDKNLPEPPWDVAFTIDRNTYRGRTSLQLRIKDLRAARV